MEERGYGLSGSSRLGKSMSDIRKGGAVGMSHAPRYLVSVVGNVPPQKVQVKRREVNRLDRIDGD